jgi:hypothetical protein
MSRKNTTTTHETAPVHEEAANVPDINLLTADEKEIEAIKAEGKGLAVLNHLLETNNKPTKVRVFTVLLNKDMAEMLLKFNLKNPIVANRPINWGTVESMSRQILNGHFRNTGEPLLFTDTGDGIDLQHRCHAVIKAAETNPNAGFETTVVTGVHVDNMESLIDNLLVMGVAKRTKMNLAHFANVDARKWEMVEYYLLPEDIRPGGITRALSKLEINDEYKKKKSYYDDSYQKVANMFSEHEDVNVELGEKRLPLYAAIYLKMNDINPDAAFKFMSAFFNPLENDLPKGNAVDAIRQELVNAFAVGQRDLTRPIFIRRGMLAAFKEFVDGTIKTKWHSFIATTMPAQPKPQRGRKAADTIAAA